MEAVLRHITKDYRAFVDDQVLTAGQLNEFIDYFEDQDRLSRVCLTGAGLACGFEVSKSANTISITQGCAITTDGDLLKLLTSNDADKTVLAQGQINYKHFKKFENKPANYKHFIKDADTASESQIELWELLPEGTQNANDKSLTDLDLNDKIVLLYLDSYTKEDDICTETNCDNQGERRVNQLRVLLVSEKDIDHIAGLDAVYTRHNILPLYSLLPEIKMPRLILTTGIQQKKNPPKIDLTEIINLDLFRKDIVFESPLKVNTLKAPSLFTDFRTKESATVVTDKLLVSEIANFKTPTLLNTAGLLDLSKFATLPNLQSTINTEAYSALASSYRSLILSTLNQLEQAYEDLHEGFASLLNLSAKAKNKTQAYFKNLRNDLPALDIQYAYDHVRDLVLTYAGIKDLLYRIQVECCPQVNAFPKHIMLGKLDDKDRFKTYRHTFYHSELHPKNEHLQRAKFLVQRFNVLAATYTKKLEEEIKITPSTWYSSLLASKGGVTYKAASIPFYYEVDSAFLPLWDFDMTTAYREKFNLSYHRKPLNNAACIQDPLAYDLSEFDFLRIEGILGKKYDEVIKELDKLKREHALSFDVKAVSIDQKLEDIDIDEYACHFGFLDTSLKSWTAEQDCLNAEITKFFSGFSLKIPGLHNYAKGNFKINTELVKKAATPGLSLLSSSKEKMLFTDLASAKSTSTSAKTTDNTFSAKAKTARVTMNSGIEYIAPVKKETPVNKVVKEELYTKADDLGTIMDVVLKEDYVGNYLDIFTDFDREVKDKFPVLPEVKNDTITVTRTIPAKIIALLQVASSYIPSALNQVSETTKENFTAAMADLCEYVEEAIDTVNTIFYAPESEYEWVGYENIYMTLLYRLQENCCAAERLEILITEIEERKTKILDELIFENFARKHPGLEHKAGVPMGGTFVLVYSGVAKSAEDKSIPANTVVADFCLPYQCCSDCAPIGFIVPDLVGQGSIILENDELCVDETVSESISMGMTVSPENGIVALTNTSIKGLAINNNQLEIDPQNFNGYDVPLSFTVNGQLTNAKLTVYKKPQLSIIYSPEKPTSLLGNSVDMRFTYQNENNFNASRFKFSWEIDGENYTGERTGHTIKIDQDYDKDSYEFPVSLHLEGKHCGAEINNQMIEIEIVKQDDIIIEMDETIFCSDDRNEYEIITVPPTKEVEITGDGVSKIDGKYFFIPAKATEKNIEIQLVDGNKIDVTVVPRTASATLSQERNKEKGLLVVSTDFKTGEEYQWTFNDEKIAGANGSKIVFSLAEAKTGEVGLTIINKPCPAIIAEPIKIEIQTELKCPEASKIRTENNLRELMKIFENTGNDSWLQDESKRLIEIYNAVLKDETFWDDKTLKIPAKMFDQISTSKDAAIEMIHGEKQPTAYFDLYRLSIDLLYNLTRCFEDIALANFEPEFNKIGDHFNPENEFKDSFKNFRDDFEAGEKLKMLMRDLSENAHSSMLKEHAAKILSLLK